MTTRWAIARERAARVGITVIVGIGISLAVTIPAQAHNSLVSSTPAADEVLTVLPDQFVITTNDAMLELGGQAGGFALQVTDSAGLYYGDGCLVVDGPSMMTPAALGAPGTYTLTWQAVSADGHTISDEFSFTWQPAATDSVPSQGSPTPPVCGVSATAEPTASAEPTTPTPSAAPQEQPADNNVLWIAAGVVAAAVVVVAAVLLSRRKK